MTTFCRTKSHIMRELMAPSKLLSHLGLCKVTKRTMFRKCQDRSFWKWEDNLIQSSIFKGNFSSSLLKNSQLLWMKWIKWTWWTCLKTTSGGYSTTDSFSSFSCMSSSFKKSLSPIWFSSNSNTVWTLTKLICFSTCMFLELTQLNFSERIFPKLKLTTAVKLTFATSRICHLSRSIIKATTPWTAPQKWFNAELWAPFSACPPKASSTWRILHFRTRLISPKRPRRTLLTWTSAGRSH